MASTTLSLGSVVRNFNTTAKVVGFFSAADGRLTGDLILRQIGANGKLRGGKWVADPAKCEEVAQ